MYNNLSEVPDEIKEFYYEEEIDNGVVVSQVSKPETKSLEDLGRIVSKNQDNMDQVLVAFAPMVNAGIQWKWFESYLDHINEDILAPARPLNLSGAEVLARYIDTANNVTQAPMANSPSIITVGAFLARLYVTERYAIRSSEDIYLNDIWEDLLMRSYVDLDNNQLLQGVGYVINILTTVPNFQLPDTMTVLDPSTRISQLLVDGSTEEMYKGII